MLFSNLYSTTLSPLPHPSKQRQQAMPGSQDLGDLERAFRDYLGQEEQGGVVQEVDGGEDEEEEGSLIKNLKDGAEGSDLQALVDMLLNQAKTDP